jgi:hypothetical protein
LSKDLGVFSFLALILFQEFSIMFYAEQQRRERYVSVFDIATLIAVRAARFFRDAARRAKCAHVAEVAKRPQKDARKAFRAGGLHAQAPPDARQVRMREAIEASRMQRLL